MALIDDVKNEILQANARKTSPEAPKEKPRRARRQKTKEEIAEFVARKQAEEERRYLKQQEAKAHPEPAAAHGKRCKPKPEKPAKEERPAKPGQLRAKRQKGTCSKARPKTIRTIDLPDGGSLLIVYMPGPS